LGIAKHPLLVFTHRVREISKSYRLQAQDIRCSYAPSESKQTLSILNQYMGVNLLPMSHFLECTLSPSNAIIHPSLMYGKFGPYSDWDGAPLPEKPLLYEHATGLGSYVMSQCSDELQILRRALEKHIGVELPLAASFLDSMRFMYCKDDGTPDFDDTNALTAFRTCKAYVSVRFPLKQEPNGGFVIDPQHRFFVEDLPHGLVIFRDLADMTGVDLPVISSLLEWGQKIMGKEYLKDGKLKGKDMGETSAPSILGVRSAQELLTI